MWNFSRRDFLKYGSLVAASGASLQEILAGESCVATNPDILGPFFQPDAPFRTRIASPAEPGERLFIQGSVSDCRGPVPGAVIEVWQANAAGCYSINEDCGVIPGNPDDFRLRARIKTDGTGRYEFETIKPAPYDVGGGRFRPSHIHYKVTLPPSGSEERVELITQVYFQGEKYNNTDPYSSKLEAKSRTIPLDKDPAMDLLQGRFDIVLPSPFLAGRTAELQGHDLLIRKLDGKVRFHLPEEHTDTSVVGIYSGDGSLIREWEASGGVVECDVGSVPSGMYLVCLCCGELEQMLHLSL